MLQPLRLPQIAREIAAEMQHRTEIHNLIVDFPPDFPILEADPAGSGRSSGTFSTTPSNIRRMGS